MRFHSTLVVGALLALTATAAVAETGIGARRAARHDLLSGSSPSVTSQPTIDGRERAVVAPPRSETVSPIVAGGNLPGDITAGTDSVVLRRVVASWVPFPADLKTIEHRIDRRAIHGVTATADIDWDDPGVTDKANLPRPRFVVEPTTPSSITETK